MLVDTIVTQMKNIGTFEKELSWLDCLRLPQIKAINLSNLGLLDLVTFCQPYFNTKVGCEFSELFAAL